MSGHRVCPWWLGYFLAGRWRRWFQDPEKLLAPYVRPEMRVLEPGPGMGFFTLPLAQIVGDNGRVYAVDVQPKMLRELQHRAEKAGLAARIETRVVNPESMALGDLAGSIDFALVFAVAHEVPDISRFFAEISSTLKPDAKVLFVEPAGHVSKDAFAIEVAAAEASGLGFVSTSQIRRGRSALLQKAFRGENATGKSAR